MSSKNFTKKKFCWLAQINHDTRVRKIDLAVAVELTEYFNEKDHGGRAWPSCKTIADTIGVHEVTVLNSGKRLQKAGHLDVVPGRQGRGRTNQYWMKIKPASEQVKKPAGEQDKKPASQSRKPAGGQENPSKNPCREENSKEFSSLGERDDRLRGRQLPPPGGPPERPPGGSEEAPQAAAASREESSPAAAQTSPPSEPEGRKEGATEEGAEPLTPAKTSPPSEPHAPMGETLPPVRSSGAGGNGAAVPVSAFERLRAIWQRGHPKDETAEVIAAAKAAFAKVIAEGARPDQVFAGGERWVAAAVAGDGLRYLPQLPVFLSTRGFEKKPPPPKQRQAHSAPRRRQDATTIMLAAGQRRAARRAAR